MNLLNPAAWNGIGIVTFLIVAVAGSAWLLLTGRVVLGVHHRELMAQKDREIAAKDARAMEDAKSIAMFAEAATVTTVAAEVQQALVTALRQVTPTVGNPT